MMFREQVLEKFCGIFVQAERSQTCLNAEAPPKIAHF